MFPEEDKKYSRCKFGKYSHLCLPCWIFSIIFHNDSKANNIYDSTYFILPEDWDIALWEIGYITVGTWNSKKDINLIKNPSHEILSEYSESK